MSLALALVSWKHLSIPQLAPLRDGNHALAAVAAIFERHHQLFHFDDASVPLIYLLLFIGASVRTFSWAARSSFFPTLVPRDAFANAVTWNNSVFQIGSVVGPALSGFLVAFVGFSFVYLLDALCSFSFFLLVLLIRRSAQKREQSDASTWNSLMAGLRFVFSRKVILATITLDLFAVLLGGATALMPIFADQILHCGPVGLGWMRAMPAIGAFVMALLIAHLPPMKHAGKALMWCVTGFGLATILFGLSKVFWLSLGVLFLLGAFDSVERDHSRVDRATGHAGRNARTRLIREQYFHRHIERVRRAGIGIDCCAIWAGHFGRCGRDRNDSCRAGRGMALAGNAKDWRAGSDSALNIKERRLPSRRSLSCNQNAPCNEIVPYGAPPSW